MRAAAIQMNSTGDRPRNRATAERLVRAAAADGARLVVLPEKWNVLGTPEQLAAGAEPLDGPSIDVGARARAGAARRPDRRLDRRAPHRRRGRRARQALQHLRPRRPRRRAARRLPQAPPVRRRGGRRRLPRVGRRGPGRGDRRHDARGRRRSSAWRSATTFASPSCSASSRCAARACSSLPSAFTLATTRDHWEVLVRARAIEDQCFVVAANQIGEHAARQASRAAAR